MLPGTQIHTTFSPALVPDLYGVVCPAWLVSELRHIRGSYGTAQIIDNCCPLIDAGESTRVPLHRKLKS